MNESNRNTMLAKTVTAAAILAIAGAAVAQFGTEAGGSRPPTASAPTPPSAPPPPTPSSASAPRSGGTSVSSVNMVVNDNGRTIKLEMKDNVVTRAEIDGEVIPDSRIENDGNTVTLKGASGEVLYETEAGGGMNFGSAGRVGAFDPKDSTWRRLVQISPHTFAISGQNGLGGAWGLGSAGALNPEIVSAWGEANDTPAVMIGVQLGSPDSNLCGHLGVDRRKSTLLTAVHDGLPAGAAGLEPYDVIVSINGSDDASPAAVRAALREKKVGESLTLGIIHQGAKKDVTVTVEAYDRKKLSASKVQSVDAGDDPSVFAMTAPRAPMPPLPPSIPEEYRKQIEQYYKDNGQQRARMKLFEGSGGQEKLLAEIERAQRQVVFRGFRFGHNDCSVGKPRSGSRFFFGRGAFCSSWFFILRRSHL